MLTDIQQFARIEATFTPQRSDDLNPRALRFIGRRLTWLAAWVVEDGPYKGQWAFTADINGSSLGLGWVPECDLSDIQKT